MNQSEKWFSIDVQHIDLSEFTQSGMVLDIGGGGEGIIGQLLGEKVVAIDTRADELAEAADGPLKIIMDARKLKFLDSSFDGATSFFTLMYIEKNYQEKVFQEIYRVLKDRGQFTIWDVTIPKYPGGDKDIFLLPLEIKTKEKILNTAYGVLWEKSEQNLNYFIELANNTGFEIIRGIEIGEIFCIELRKNVSR